jgi:hypothetical protein
MGGGGSGGCRIVGRFLMRSLRGLWNDWVITDVFMFSAWDKGLLLGRFGLGLGWFCMAWLG